jgi:hypothetical protein
MSDGTLMLHELVTGACCYLRAADGRSLAFTQSAGFHLSRTSRTWFEITETGDHKLLFRCAHGPYLCARPDSHICAAHSPSGWEAFTACTTGDSRLCLQSFHGDYVCALAGNRSPTLCKSPPKPHQNIALLRAFEPQECERAIQRTRPGAKTVWAFWDAGREAMCPFYKLNVRTWHHVLGPEWRINVLNVVAGDDCNVFNFIDASALPASFPRLSAVAKSDALRLALLSTYGGVWMDVGIVLRHSLDQICWEDMSSPGSRTLLAGFFNSGWGSDHLDRRDDFETWFIAARSRNVFVERWRHVLAQYWDDRTHSTDICGHPLFESLDLSNFHRYGLDLRNYLTPNVAFRKVLEADPHMHSLWRHNMRLQDAGEGPFLLPHLVGWQSADIYRALVVEYREDLVQQLETTSLMKFTGGMSSHLTQAAENTLLDGRSTLGRIFRRILES